MSLHNDSSDNGRQKLSFWSQNLCRLNNAQQDWLVSLNTMKYTIGFAQEPYIDSLGNSRANHTWVVLYPSMHKRRLGETRTYTLVHTLLKREQWAQVLVQLPDVVAMQISDGEGDLYVFNVYLNQKHSDALFEINSTIRMIKQAHTQSNRPAYFLWAGDFN
jgi:hypothetical protein